MAFSILEYHKIKEFDSFAKSRIEVSVASTNFIWLIVVAICDNPSDKEIEIVKDKEGERLKKIIPSNSYKIVLDLKGQMLDSIELSKKISDVFSYNNSNISFIIGGSLGLSNEILKNADYHLCFSKMTFPHQLMQVILLEQIYRSFKIINNEVYHK